MGIECVSSEFGEMVHIGASHQSRTCDNGVTNLQFRQRLAEGMHIGDCARRTGGPLPSHRSENGRIALHRGALHVVQYPTNTTQFGATAGPAWSTMQQRGQR